MNLQQELEQLRKLLEEKDHLIAVQQEKLSRQEEQIKKQQIQIENMIQALLHARKKIFGSSSEKTQVEGQMHLFMTEQELAVELLKQQKEISVKAHKKTPRKSGVREEMLSGLKKEVVEYLIPREEVCPKCGDNLTLIGKEVIRTEVEFVPAKLLVKQIVRQVAKCTSCGKKGSERKTPSFVKAQVPKPILPHSFSTPSLVAQVLYQKFSMGMPYDRQEKDWYRLGLVLSRADMAYWTIRCSEEWFLPVYQRIHEKLLSSCALLHMDETRIQCNKEPGRKASSDSFMWVMRSGAGEELQGAFFHYSPYRNREVAKSLLGDYKGYLVTDAYVVYEDAGEYQHCLCFAHCRRYFIEAIPLDNKGKEIPGSKGAEGREFINLLFAVEEKIKDLSLEEKKKKRLEESKPILEAFWSWVEKTSALPTTNEKLTKALTYATNQRKGLDMFLKDGRIPISNNLCEANIKPFATARRAWLFADSQKGAKATAVLYTLVESAKANHLDIYEYLKYLLEEMPNNRHLEYPEIIDRYLPWSKELPERCRLRIEKKKYFKN